MKPTFNTLFSLMVLLVISCKNPSKEIEQLAVAKSYYEALQTADVSKLPILLTDSLSVIETKADYVETFS